MVVSKHFPSITAEMEDPLPRWQVTILVPLLCRLTWQLFLGNIAVRGSVEAVASDTVLFI